MHSFRSPISFRSRFLARLHFASCLCLFWVCAVGAAFPSSVMAQTAPTASTWYVDGSLATPGDGRSPVSALRTIGEALARAQAGDSIQVAAGTYLERPMLPPGVTLQGAGYRQTTIDGQGAEMAVVRLSTNSAIQGFTITGSGTSYWDAGIRLQGHGALIANNRITGNSSGIALLSCTNPASCQTATRIEFNIIDHNQTQGIAANEHSWVSVRNNTIVENQNFGIALQDARSVVENNIIVGHSAAALQAPAGSTIRTNNLLLVGQHQQWPVGEGTLALNPLFRNPAQADYRLTAGSPMRKRGSPTGSDLGALPFQVSAPAPPPVQIDLVNPFSWTLRSLPPGASGVYAYVGRQSQAYEHRFDLANQTSFVLQSLPSGFSYFAAISTYDAGQNESELSSEVSFATPTLSLGVHQEASAALAWSGEWQRVADGRAQEGAYLQSSQPGATLELGFEGDGLIIRRTLAPNGGQMQIYLDGKFVGMLDFGFVEERFQVPFVLDNLGSGVHHLRLTLAASSQLGSVWAGIDAIELPTPAATLTQTAALAEVNWHRQQAGIPLVQLSGALNLAAEAHAVYRLQYPEDKHQEFYGKTGFIGQWATDRARYFGYGQFVGEDLFFLTGAIPGAPIASAVDIFMSNVYHRGLILDYAAHSLGYASAVARRYNYESQSEDHSVVLNMSAHPALKRPVSQRVLYTYPANGQSAVPLAWDGNETPTPLPAATRPLGYPISIYLVQPNLPGAQNVEPVVQAPQTAENWLLTVAELRNSRNELIPAYHLDQSNDAMLGADVAFLVPDAPLQPQERYTVRFAGYDSRGLAFDYVAHFTTAALVEMPMDNVRRMVYLPLVMK